MSLGLRIRLSFMMFLQYFVWGIWLPILGLHLGSARNDLGTSKPELIGWIYTVYGFGSILGPFLIGQLADRYMATEKVMAAGPPDRRGPADRDGVCHRRSGHDFPAPVRLLQPLHADDGPVELDHLPQSVGEGNQDHLPGRPVVGDAWAGSPAGLSFAAYLDYKLLGFFQTMFDLFGLNKAFMSLLGWWLANVVPTLESLHKVSWVGEPQFRDCLRGAGDRLAVLRPCTASPCPTPRPRRSKADTTQGRQEVGRSWRAWSLMRVRSFAVLVVVAGLIGIMLAFYFACENDRSSPPSASTRGSRSAAYMVIGQVAEAPDDRPGPGGGPPSSASSGHDDDRRGGLGAAVRPVGLRASRSG